MKLVLKCLNDSFKFETKKLSLANQIIIGRQVDGTCSQDNGMFECRVLSKNHAIIWTGNNKVYIKDTNSSNGTFINDRRINHENDNQPAYEITRSTILQFGVSVTTPDGVFHPCVICRVDIIEQDMSSHSGSLGGDVSQSLLGELESLVGEVIVGHDNVDRQLDLFESNLAIWEDAITFNLQGKLQVNDLVSRISFLHDQLSLISPKTLTSFDEETFAAMASNRDTLYRAHLESALKEKDDLLTILAQNEEKTIDCFKRVELYSKMNENYKREAALNTIRMDKLIEEKNELCTHLNNSEDEIQELNSIIQDYKARLTANEDNSDDMPGIYKDVKFKTMDDLSAFEQVGSEDSQLQWEEEEKANCALLSGKVTDLEQVISILNARIVQLSTVSTCDLPVQAHSQKEDGGVRHLKEDGGVRHLKEDNAEVYVPCGASVQSKLWNYQRLCILLLILFVLVTLFNVCF